MAIVVKAIGSAGGRDYSSLAAWAASLPANLVTDGNSYQGECYNDSEFTGASTLLNLSGHTTDAGHTITLTTGVGQSFRDNANVQTNALRYNAANGVAITSSVGYASGTISISDDNVFLSNLQVRNTAGTGTAINAQPASNVSVTIDDCVIANTGGGRGPLMGSLQTTIRNSLLYATGGPPWVIDGGGVAGSGFPSCHFCTIASASDAPAPPEALHGIYSTGMLRNCAFFGCTAVTAGSSTFMFTNCMTDVASPPSGVTGGKTYDDQFQNTTAALSDFREKSDADLQGAGIADGTNGATDIVGTARPQSARWDIGCWELQATGTIVAVEAPAPIEHLTMQRVDSLLGLSVEFGGGVTNGAVGCVESLARAFIDQRLASELLTSLLRNVTASGEFAISVSREAPAPAEWLGAIATVVTADAIPLIEWSALSSPVRVSLERLRASPGKRRQLSSPGRLRLLKRL